MLEVPQNGVESGEEAKAPAITLPFGDTLHYPSCGCPAGWQNTTRAADVVDILVQKAFQAYQEGRLAATRPLRVLYFLPHHNVTGGMKCLVEHVRLLKLRGEKGLKAVVCIYGPQCKYWTSCRTFTFPALQQHHP